MTRREAALILEMPYVHLAFSWYPNVIAGDDRDLSGTTYDEPQINNPPANAASPRNSSVKSIASSCCSTIPIEAVARTSPQRSTRRRSCWIKKSSRMNEKHAVYQEVYYMYLHGCVARCCIRHGVGLFGLEDSERGVGSCCIDITTRADWANER